MMANPTLLSINIKFVVPALVYTKHAEKLPLPMLTLLEPPLPSHPVKAEVEYVKLVCPEHRKDGVLEPVMLGDELMSLNTKECVVFQTTKDLDDNAIALFGLHEVMFLETADPFVKRKTEGVQPFGWETITIAVRVSLL